MTATYCLLVGGAAFKIRAFLTLSLDVECLELLMVVGAITAFEPSEFCLSAVGDFA